MAPEESVVAEVRHAVAVGDSPGEVARAIVRDLAAPDLKLAFVFADWHLDAEILTRELHAGLAPARIVGGTTPGVIGPPHERGHAVVALGLYGDWVRIGIGVGTELVHSPLTRSRDAMAAAAMELGLALDALSPQRHVGVTIVDGKCGQEETFCIGSAAAAPQIRVVGGCSASSQASNDGPFVFVDGAALQGAGAVVLLDSDRPFHALISSHLVQTDHRVVVTSASGRIVHELDGKPAAVRLREVATVLGHVGPIAPSNYAFARFIDGIPYVRSIRAFDGTAIQLASGVERGHVLRVMRPGDLIGTTEKDLAHACAAVGGKCAALLAFSCQNRHWEADERGLTAELAAVYGAHGAIGYQSGGEQSGMLLVNHTLTGLAIGGAPE